MADQPEKEVRFAVVMYGGVSLAIYINGVTQELMSMVRATARSVEKDGAGYHLPNVKGVEAVYRKLGEHLKARFVVDILSGTSAGGINAVYLAKALANDQQIDQLKELWIKEGDIGLLVNDKESVKKLEGLVAPDKPASLLNSQRMYYQLLDALRKMKGGNAASKAGASPYVEELDLFITSTDLQGLALPIRNSSGELPRERRFRNVFHFHYATSEAIGMDEPAQKDDFARIDAPVRKKEPINDFKKENDPFLAFAARCTSSFPFAFEPMRLQDVEIMLGRGIFKDYSYQPEAWAQFYKDYEPKGFPDLSFGDGGYLDNKPFSYATATLNRRRADLPVDRKLVYIEPAPERIQENSSGKPEPPDAIANVLLALLTLPRYETVREDLQAVSDRNGLIQNVNYIVQNIESVSQGISLKPWLPSRHWRNQFLDQLVRSYGPGYLIYHQLRVEEVLQDLSEMIVRGIGWEEDSPQAKDLLSLLHAWRHAHYKTSSKEKEPEDGIRRKSENDLLFRLDTRWRIRRLQYLQGLIDALLKDLGNNKFATAGSKSKSILDHSQADWQVNQSNQEDYRSAFLLVKKKINEAYVHLRGKGRAMRARNLVAEETSLDNDREEYKTYLHDLKSFFAGKDRDGGTQLEELTGLSAAQTANRQLNPEQKKYYQESLKRLEELSLVLSKSEAKPKNKGLIRAALSHLSAGIEMALKPPPKSKEESELPEGVKTALEHVRKCLTYYHDRFEYFDMLTFPITYGTNVGESDVVEIIRISPEDAVKIVDKEYSHTKLAGTKLGNFGAFFNPQWRENDMLWGRLDGAECLIKAVWPEEQDESKRDEFIREAHQAILDDFLLSNDKMKVLEALFGSKSFTSLELQQAKARLTGDNTLLLDNFKTNYRVDQNFPPEPTLKVMARSTSVLGKLMGSLSEKYPLLSEPAGISTRFGSIFFAMISVALSQSLPGLLFERVMSWVYLVELMFITLGRVLIEVDTPNRGIDFNRLGTDMSRLGAKVIIGTLLIHLLIVTLSNVMTTKWSIARITRTARVMIFAILLLGGLTLLYSGLLYLGAFPEPTGVVGSSLDLLKQILGP